MPSWARPSASGDRRAIDAAQEAIASPLLEAGAIDGARGILINITGSTSLKLAEVNEASTIIQSAAHEDANIIFGAVLDEKMKDEVKITVIATGFREPVQPPRQGPSSFNAAQSSHLHCADCLRLFHEQSAPPGQWAVNGGSIAYADDLPRARVHAPAHEAPTLRSTP